MTERHVDPDLVRSAPRSKSALRRLLFDGLDWPLPASLEPEDVPFLHWSPEELHLDPAAIAKLTSVEQLPKLTDDQPFGVFILSFQGGRLPIGAVRRLVNQLVRQQRARRKLASSLWDLEDLIFFCRAGSQDGVLHVVSFRESEGRAVLKVISWGTTATDNRVRLVSGTSLPLLRWPDANTSPIAWRERWTSAFTSSYRQGIRSAARLASTMADVAVDVRDEVRSLFDVETEEGPLRTLFRELRSTLRADLDADGFADMYAQTMVYGLLTARITHPADFSADSLDLALAFENPLLDSLYGSFSQQDQTLDVDEFGLRDLAEVLASTDIDEVLADFGAENRREDPVVFFYEEFLDKYDPRQRRELGTYYTPIPVVRFMVRAVDHVLRTHLHLPKGIVDDSTWAEYCSRVGIPVPETVDPTHPVVRMIDPATGTGTFVLEWLRAAFDATVGDSAESRAAILDRVDALEINLSSYSVAHLKSALAIPRDLREGHHVDIRLTDTLAPDRRRQLSVTGDDPIAQESERARSTKFQQSHTIVIGNPPYLRTSGGASGGGLGGMIRYGESGDPGLIEDFTAPLAQINAGKHAKNLYNLYVYFWRWGIWKVRQHKGPAVVAYITASSYLTGQGFAGMRKFMREQFDNIWVIDLGGEGRGSRPDENVFLGVRTPVAITIAVRSPDRSSRNGDLGDVRYARILGDREAKLEELSGSSLSNLTFERTELEPFATFVPPLEGDYADWPALTDLFPWQHSGSQLKRTWPISPSRDLLVRRWQHLRTTAPEDRATLFRETRDRKVTKSPRALLTSQSGRPIRELTGSDAPEAVTRYAYRSFDRQWVIADSRVGDYLRPQLWGTLSESQVFLTSLLTGRVGSGPAATAAVHVPDLHHFRGSYGAKDVVPLYRSSDLTPNMDPHVLESLNDLADGQLDGGRQASTERLFAYAYGVLAGADYSTRFMDELEVPGPRLPISLDAGLFSDMADLGEHLLWLHTFGERFESSERTDLRPDEEIRWSRPVTRLPKDADDFWYDSDELRLHVADGALEGVAPDVWAFEVSGMLVLSKWLAYRTHAGAGRAKASDSPLDAMRPDAWTSAWSDELRELVHVLTLTVDYAEVGTELLDTICAGPLLNGQQLPAPDDSYRKAPRGGVGDGARLLLEVTSA